VVGRVAGAIAQFMRSMSLGGTSEAALLACVFTLELRLGVVTLVPYDVLSLDLL
jgi:hypothetical protein